MNVDAEIFFFRLPSKIHNDRHNEDVQELKSVTFVT